MDPTQAEGSSVFMCKICNLFSPNKSLLLSHVLETHTKEGSDADDVIVPLKPLQSSEAPSTESVVKRKRGRPKGSTKKVQADKARSSKASVQPKKETSSQNEQPESVAEQQSEDDTGLECRKCQRKFSNKRQISKHICFAGLREVTDEDWSHGNNPDTVKAVDGEESVERTPKKARTTRTDKALSVKDPESTSCTKNPIVSVVLAAHEAIPGATKIVPIEAAPAEAVIPADATAEESALKKGYQEYAIQQAAYEVPLKSNRLGRTQLKIFTCEYCNKVFKFKHSLQAHLRIHTNEKPFKCPQCDYASTIKANLSVHMRKHTGEKFSCDHCSFSCLSKGHLKVHVERVHQKVKQHCRFCKKKYSDVKNLLKHIRESHDLEDHKVKECYDECRLQTREGKRQLLYDCQICDRKFKNELDRDRHLMVHGSKRPFGCELCDHGSTKFQALQAHIRKHPFVYVCAICLEKFVSSVRLKSHFQQSHPEVDKSTAFSESIQSSFCLLKPGDDIQHDMLKQEELEITKELALLNSEEVLVTEVGTIEECEEQAQCLVGLGTETDSLNQDSQEGLPPTDSISNCPVIETGETVETRTHGTVCGTILEKGPQDCGVTEFENPDKENPSAEVADVSLNQRIQTGDASDISVAQGESVTQSNPAPSGGEDLARTDQEEKSAFLQILDQMQKRQLNMEIFERIRKVYGDLECEYCGKLFWYQVHYNMHVRTHTREHLHYCSQCSYSSITKNCLKRHVIQKHSNILIKCPSEGCQYCTPDKYKLQAHLKTHSEIIKKLFICPICKESFPEDKLRYHVKTTHPDASWSSISDALGIRVHVKGVIGKRASKCPYCHCFFTRNGADMQQHIWAHEGSV
ncbi:hypothetical protein NFI96_033348 [Prochilodus magdalenae]|nr:hypothetical protein NFI96_033348 [Prochilodus magdalenae]